MSNNMYLDPDYLYEQNHENFEDYICCICQYIPYPENAVEEENCGHIFCQYCLKRWMRKSCNCPYCKEKISIRNIKDENKIIYRHLINLIIKCQEANCDWKGIWKEYKDHLEKEHNKIIKIEENNINNYELYKYYKATVHEHPLKFLDMTMNTGWICDGAKLPNKCISGINDFDQTSTLQRFRCVQCDYDLCENCMDKYYDKNYAIKNDNSNNRDIYLLDKRYYTSIHKHPLIFLGIGKPNDIWVCNGRDLAEKCFSGINYFNETMDIPRFRCDKCNYDLCENCMNHYKRKENYEWNKFYKIKIHSHPLKFLDKTRNNEDWICSGIYLEDECLSEINDYGQTKDIPRFKCETCEYNLCKNCMDYYYNKPKECIIF